MGGEFGGSGLELPKSAKSKKDGKHEVFESYNPGPMATPVIMTETAEGRNGKQIRLTTVGGITIRQTIAANILSSVLAGNDGSGANAAIDVASVVNIALRLTDSLMFQTRDDAKKFTEDLKAEVPDTDK
jgi:hypothetical protein